MAIWLVGLCAAALLWRGESSQFLHRSVPALLAAQTVPLTAKAQGHRLDMRWTGGSGARQSRRVDIRIQCLCVDSTDPKKIASFWEAALGWRRTLDEEDQIVLEPPEGSPEDGIVPDLLFLRVPEKQNCEESCACLPSAR